MSFPVPMRTIRVMFLSPADNDPWINRLVARIDPPFCHVEIEFDDSSTGPCLASSIYAGETVFMKRRTFANPNYTTVTLHVDEANYKRIMRFCETEAHDSVGFDETGMYLSWFGPWCPCLSWSCRPATTRRTFCSKHVTQALQAGNVPEVIGLDACRVRPSQLYKILNTSKRRCFSTVPYKMNLMSMRVQTI